MQIEVCVERLNTALAADQSGADRIELCSALDIGGLTPSHGLIQACVAQCELDVFVMIRPHGGSFIYTQKALEVMLADIKAVEKAGAKGVVFGCLTFDSKIDLAANKF